MYPEIEEELRKKVIDPAAFDAVCAHLPGLEPWVNPRTATPISRVFGMGDLSSRWRSFAPDGRTMPVLGFFPVGQTAYVRSMTTLWPRPAPSPPSKRTSCATPCMLVRGPAARLQAYQRRIGAELFTLPRRHARSGPRHAPRAVRRHPGYRPTSKGQMTKAFLEDGVLAIAIRIGWLELFRAASTRLSACWATRRPG